MMVRLTTVERPFEPAASGVWVDGAALDGQRPS
jgi:hypothetical protein